MSMDFLAEIKQVGQIAAQTIENMELPPEGSSLVDIIMHTTRDFHSDKTGGTLNKIDLATAHIITGFILREGNTTQIIGGKKFTVHYPYIAAVIAGESCFDPFAKNPNNQNGSANDPPDVIAKRTDYGLGQINGQPEYLGQINLSIIKVTSVLASNLAFAQTIPISGGDDDTPFVGQLTIASQAYNSGQLGSVEATSFAYGTGVIGRYDAFCKVLGITPLDYPLIPVDGPALVNGTLGTNAVAAFASDLRKKWL